MAIDTDQVVTLCPEPARRHASNVFQSGELIFAGLVRMIVGAFIAVGAVFPEIVYVTHVDLLDSVDFGFVVLQLRVNTLAVAVTRNAGSGGGRVRSWWRRSYICWRRHGGRCPRRCCWIHRSRIRIR